MHISAAPLQIEMSMKGYQSGTLNAFLPQDTRTKSWSSGEQCTEMGALGRRLAHGSSDVISALSLNGFGAKWTIWRQ